MDYRNILTMKQILDLRNQEAGGELTAAQQVEYHSVLDNPTLTNSAEIMCGLGIPQAKPVTMWPDNSVRWTDGDTTRRVMPSGRVIYPAQ